MVLFPLYSILFHLIPFHSMANYFSLPGIKRLSYINAKELPTDLGLLAISGTPLTLISPSVDIPFTGEATCTCTRSNIGLFAYARMVVLLQHKHQEIQTLKAKIEELNKQPGDSTTHPINDGKVQEATPMDDFVARVNAAQKLHDLA